MKVGNYTNDELLQRYRETSNGCDKKCNACILFSDECLHNFLKRWEVWKEKQHQNFKKFTEEYNGKRN